MKVKKEWKLEVTYINKTSCKYYDHEPTEEDVLEFVKDFKISATHAINGVIPRRIAVSSHWILM